MSINQNLHEPEGSVLWYWHENALKHLEQDSSETVETYIRTFERFLAVKGGYQFEEEWNEINLDNVSSNEMIKPRNIDEEIAYEFIANYLVPTYSASMQTNVCVNLSSAYTWCRERTEPVEADPIGFVLEEHDLLEEVKRRNPHIIPIEEARKIICSWDNPRWLACNLLLAKTLRRRGGVVNLDLKDVHIDHPACDWDIASEIRHSPNYLRFSRDKSRGDGVGDQKRTTGNKTETTHIVPIDDELRDALIWHLTTRKPDFDPDAPLFFGSKGKRLNGDVVSEKFKRKAQEQGHYYGPLDDDNIGVHYWRHWGTTWFEDRFGENNSITDYLRGDKGSATKAQYNQWSKKKEEIYLENVPKFFTRDQQQ